MVAYFTNLGIPRSGEFARAGLLAKYEGASFEKTFGTIIMDRIIDVICLLIVLALGFLLCFNLLWTYTKENLTVSALDGKWSWLIVIVVLFLILGLGIIYLLFTNERFANNRFLSKVKNVMKDLWEGFKSIRSINNIPAFIFYTVCIWVSYYFMTYWMFFAYAPTAHLGPLDGLLVFDMGSLGVVFPSPGGMGTYHAMVMEALKILGINSTDGFSFAMIVFFSINLFCNVAFGILGLILLPFLNRKK